MAEFYGKYRGTVTGNQDPLKLGRIQVSVPSVLGDTRSNWALPCVPYAGPDVGLFTVPPVGASVWVEFEQGDPNAPIWVGCYWEQNQLPSQAAGPEVKVFKTEGITLTLSHHSPHKGLTLSLDRPAVKKPLKLVMNDDGIELNNDNKTIAKLTEDRIEFTNRAQTKVSLSADDIELTHDPVQIKLRSKKQEILIKNNFSTIKLTGNSVEIDRRGNKLTLRDDKISLEKLPASVTLSAQGIQIVMNAMQARVAATNIELQAAGLGDIKITSAGVNINNGAFEVT